MTEEVYGRPCRACTDFKDWMKTGGPQSEKAKAKDDGSDKAKSVSKVPADHHQCPPDRMELGNKSWTLLHSIAAYFPLKPTQKQQDDAKTFLDTFSRLYPCQDCAEDLRQDLVTNPPRVTSSVEFSQVSSDWSVIKILSSHCSIAIILSFHWSIYFVVICCSGQNSKF